MFTDPEAKRLKGRYLATYREALGEIFDTNWSDSDVRPGAADAAHP
ncbi:hypothetical protein [uncultured Sphingomonas sp.]|nr:hypothetical protein [uncultured Sphingomonas sp.]